MSEPLCKSCGRPVEPGDCRALSHPTWPRGQCWDAGRTRHSDWCLWCGELLDEFGHCRLGELPPRPDADGLTRR
jgi:hypothetical protein